MTSFISSNPQFSDTDNFIFGRYYTYNIFFSNVSQKQKYFKDKFKMGPNLSEKLA